MENYIEKLIKDCMSKYSENQISDTYKSNLISEYTKCIIEEASKQLAFTSSVFSKQIQISKVYRTSRGIFWDKTDANKKSNRCKDNNALSANFGNREEVEDIYILTDGDMTFLLNAVVIK